MHLFFRLLVIFVVCFFLFDTGFAQRKPRVTQPKSKPVLSAQKIAERFLPSVVLIVCDDGKGKVSLGSGFFIEFSQRWTIPEEDLSFLTSSRAKDKSVSAGKLVISSVSYRRYVLTNYHVVEGMVRGKVKVAVGGTNSAEWWIGNILFVDKRNDLALLSIQIDKDILDLTTEPGKTIKGSGSPEPPPGLELSESDQVKVGEEVYVLSNPEGLVGTLSRGIVSSNIRQIRNVSLMQFDAPISSGSSGGAVLNSKGAVIGVATGTFSSGQNLNFAVPALSIRRFLQEYEASVKNLKVVQSAVPNGWGILVPRAPESKLPPIVSDSGKSTIGTEQNDAVKQRPLLDLTPYYIPSMTYDQVASELITSIKNSSFRSETIALTVSSVDFEGCSMSLSRIGSVGELTVKESYIVDMRSVDDFGTAPGGIRLSLVRGVLERTEIENSFEAAISDTILIPMDPEPSLRSRTILKLKRLKETCTGTKADNAPSLSESALWLTGHIQGTRVWMGDFWYQYKALQISGCSMRLVVSARGEIETQDTKTPSFRDLRKVEVTKNFSGNWGIWLEFSRNFDVTTETFGYFGRRDNGKEDKITIFFDSYEKAKRAGTAFARILELCGEKSKEPF